MLRHERMAALEVEEAATGFLADEQLTEAETAAAARAAEAEAKAKGAASAAAARPADSQAHVEIELQRLRESTSDRMLLRQAERGRQAAGQELAAAWQHAAALQRENAELRATLAAAQRQLHQLDSRHASPDQWEQQREREQQLCGALERADSQVRALEGRRQALEEELSASAAALCAARQLADACGAGEHSTASPHRGARQPQQRGQRQRRAGSLSWSELCDLEGLSSQLQGFPGGSLPGSPHSGSSDAAPASLLQQSGAREQRPEWDDGEEEEEEEEEEDGEAFEPGSTAGLQRMPLEHQRQSEALEVQQERHGQVAETERKQAWQGLAQRLEGQVQRLQRRNLHLQATLADTSMHAARAAAAARQQVVAAQEEGAQMRRQRDEATAHLAQLQAAHASLAAAAAAEDASAATSSARQRHERLHAELAECAARCSAAVEQNAALLQEKQRWLERLRAAEGEATRCRSEATQLRLQHIALLSGGGPGGLQDQQDGLVQQALEAQAAEAALRSVLGEAREEQVAACKALASELRRVHALERLRQSDIQEQQLLQRRLQAQQKECQQLVLALVELQRQAAAGRGKGGRLLLDAWAAPQGGSGDFHIAAFQVDQPSPN